MQQPPPSAPPTPLDPSVEAERNALFDFRTAQPILRQMIGEWDSEIQETEARRKKRKVEVNVAELRQSGEIKKDETFIPVRIIDTNIRREQPSFISYLKQSRRIAILKSRTDPNVNTQLLESFFTDGMQYPDWETPHFKCLEGAQTHAWDVLEVVFDVTKPLHVGIEHVGHENLVFSRTTKNIQFCKRILRRYDVTLLQLTELVKTFGFNAAQVEKLREAKKDTKSEDDTVVIYKKFCKYEGVVFVSWFCMAHGTDDWLLAPKPLYIGRKEARVKMVPVAVTDPVTGQPSMTEQPQQSLEDAYETVYPVFFLYYSETEQQRIFDHVGRVYLDQDKQEAQTAILTSFVNGLTRAANVYAAPTNPSGTGASPTVLDLVLENGRYYSDPTTFFHTDYPDPSVLRALQYLDVHNSQEVGQLNFAASNRQDSRKTATEMSIAQQQTELLNSVQVTLYSTFIRQVYGYVWSIVQNRARNGSLSLPLQDPSILEHEFDVRAAGDVDVIQRQEKISRMMQDWPVVANTPLASMFLSDLMRLKYTEDGDKYASVLAAGDPRVAVQQLLSVVTNLPPEATASLQPEEQQMLQQIVQNASQFLPQQPQQGQAQQQEGAAQ